MKKSIIAAGVGTFVVVTALLCVNPNGKMYQKQKHFDTVNDVLTQMANSNIMEDDQYGRGHETNEFKECLSQRKRLTFSQFDFNKIQIEKVEELDDQDKQSIIDDYNKAKERLSLPYNRTNIEPVRLDIKATFPRAYSDGKSKEEEFTINLVMVDEGEGMVIDYYAQEPSKNNDDNERHVNVKG